MADQREQPVQLQTDTLSNLPGAGVRTIVATVMIQGVPTPVQMQVVSIADGAGNVIDKFLDYNMQIAMIQELREIRKLLATVNGFPAIFEPIPGMESDPTIY